MSVVRLEHLIDRFDSIALSEIGASALLTRLDTKSLVAVELLPTVLDACRRDHRVVEIAGSRAARYRSVYYDTRELALYHLHHAGRLPRHKVRLREYVETGDRFLEIKERRNTGHTVKSRTPCARIPHCPGLEPTLTVRYRRLTLVPLQGRARVTIDLDLVITRGVDSARFPGLAIIEEKRTERRRSDLGDLLGALGIRPHPISKYCVGIASLYPAVRANRFKPLLRRLHRLTDDSCRSFAGCQMR